MSSVRDNVRGRLPNLLRHVGSAASIDHGSENGQGFESLYDREGKDMTMNTINSGKIEPPKPSPPCRPRLLPLKENLVIQRANRSARRGLGHEPRLFA